MGGVEGDEPNNNNKKVGDKPSVGFYSKVKSHVEVKRHHRRDHLQDTSIETCTDQSKQDNTNGSLHSSVDKSLGLACRRPSKPGRVMSLRTIMKEWYSLSKLYSGV